MKTAAVVAEYNPMHSGHIYHLDKTREISGADFVVAVMSGDFTQRGEAAVYDKWTRSRVAVNSGVDLVLELPFVYACNSAEYFASGAISILHSLGCVDVLSFGSESGDIDMLEKLAAFLLEEPEEYKKSLREHLDRGMSFPAARGGAVSRILGTDAGETLRSPNNILAIEYIKAARKWNMPAQRITMERRGSYHDSGLDGELASATAIRKAIWDEEEESVAKFLPPAGREVLMDNRIINSNTERLYPFIRAAILSGTKESLARIFAITEGMENRMIREVRRHDTLKSYGDALVSKRYTRTGIDRLLVHTLLGFEKQDLFSHRPYGRVLALNDRGARLLRRIKKESKIDMITNINKSHHPPLLKYDILASDMYNLCMGRDMYRNSDYVKSPYVDPKKED